MFRFFTVFLVAFFLLSCAPKPLYQQKPHALNPLGIGSLYGYRSQNLGDNKYRIRTTLLGKPYDEDVISRDIVLRRSAELAVEHNKDSFLILKSGNEQVINTGGLGITYSGRLIEVHIGDRDRLTKLYNNIPKERLYTARDVILKTEYLLGMTDKDIGR